MADFLEIQVQPLEPIAENAEIVTAFLSEYAFDMFELRDDVLCAFAAKANVSDEDLSELKTQIEPFVKPDWIVNAIEKQNWNELWEKNFFEPVKVDRLVCVRAEFHPPCEDAEFEIIIQPKMSFGTGHHATTQRMLGLMVKHRTEFADAEVLDMGAGTGVLAILASMLGAKHADAIDIEEWCAENIDENARLNHCSNITAMYGDAQTLSPIANGHYNIVLANIHKQVLLTDMPEYNRVLKSGGLLFLSGIYEQDLPDIKQKASELGLAYLEHSVLNTWCAVVFSK